MDQLQALRDTVSLAEDCGMPELPNDTDGLGLSHLRDMLSTAQRGGFSSDKLGRWVGWAQCAVVSARIGVTLNDMKALNARLVPASTGARDEAELTPRERARQRAETQVRERRRRRDRDRDRDDLEAER